MAPFPGWVIRCVVAGGVLAGALAVGQKPTMLVEPPVPLLHAQIADLTTPGVLTKNASEVSDELFDRAGCEIETGTPPMVSVKGPCLGILKEDGLTRLAGANYGSLQASAFQFGDATGAYSAYTFYRSMMKTPHVVGVEARLGTGSSETSADGNETVAWAGTVVLRLTGAMTKQQLAAMVAALPKVGGGKGLAPLLPTELLASGLDPASVRYAVGPLSYQTMGGVLPPDIVGWDKSAEAATATYTKGGRGTLTLLMYPTPQIAGDRGRAIEKALTEAGVDKFGALHLRRVGPMIGMTSGPWAARQAVETIAALKLDQEVTFDKKKPLEFHAEVRKTASLLQNIAAFTGIAVAAAVLLGLFLGFGRAGLRKLQGKPAYIEPEFLSISLRDKPKALFVPKDQEPG